MNDQQIFKVLFQQRDEVFEIYAQSIFQSDMYGFIEVEKLLFGEKSQLLVDPTEEKIKAEFQGVTRSYIPMHSIIRIDEVEKEGTAKISEGQNGNVSPFPGMPVADKPVKKED